MPTSSKLGIVGRGVDPADSAKVIDMVNRLNIAFDDWDIEAMLEVFTEDCVLQHPRGVIHGHDELRKFYEGYFPLTPGVRRHSLNHVVDANDDGTITVTSYMVLIRTVASCDAKELDRSGITVGQNGLPSIFTHARILDRFRKEAMHGWRFVTREVKDTVVNLGLRPT